MSTGGYVYLERFWAGWEWAKDMNGSFMYNLYKKQEMNLLGLFTSIIVNAHSAHDYSFGR